MRKIKGNNSGISLITIIIMIIVIIILAAITMYSQFSSVDRATYAKFIQEYREVQKSVDAVRITNTKDTMNNINNGFSRVNVNGEIPYNFTTILPGEDVAYLVDLNLIGCDALTTGKDYPKFDEKLNNNEIQTVTFGKDDVYVYDSQGTLFYAKGYMDENGELSFDTNLKNSPIKIINIEKTKNNDSTTMNVKVTIQSENEIKSVTVDGQDANETSDGVYELEISKNGNYVITVIDEKDFVEKEKISIVGLGSIGAPEVTAVVKNGTYENGVYKISGKTAELEITSDTAKSLYISTENVSPSSWFSYASNVERHFETTGEKSLYIWVRDENGIECSSPFNIRILVEEETQTKPTVPHEDISSDDIIIADITEDIKDSEGNGWAKERIIEITFPEGKQSDGYVSSYQVKTSSASTAKVTIAYSNKVTVPVNKNGTEIIAKVSYKSAYKSDDNVKSATYTVTGIDSTPPVINALYPSNDKPGMIEALVKENESELAGYFVTSKYYDIKSTTPEDISDTWLEANYSGDTRKNGTIEASFDFSGRLYLYVKDIVGNITQKSLMVEAPDIEAPNIISVKATLITNTQTAVIQATATDNVGVVAYAIIKDNSTDTPSVWNSITEQKEVTFEHTVSENGRYCIWVKDAAGLTKPKSIELIVDDDGKEYGSGLDREIILYAYPTLDAYPQNVRILEGEKAKFEVKIDKSGIPNVYTYAWQRSKDNGKTWEGIPGATASTYETPITTYEDNMTLYKCKVTNKRGTIETRAASLEIVRITTEAPSVVVSQDSGVVLAGLIINNGEKTTNQNKLQLKIAAINAYEVNISESDTKSDNWVDYSTNIQYDLKDTSTGEKKITVWIRAKDGTEAPNKVSATITKVIE